MAENNELISALANVPELVKTTKIVLEDTEKKYKILAEAVQKRMQAEIPSSEIEKISGAASTAVSRTKCASPDVAEAGQLIAAEAAKAITDIIKPVAIEAVKAAVADTPVIVKHQHTHTTLGQMCQMAEKTIHNWIVGLAIYSIILTLAGGVATYFILNGEKHVGTEYADIYFSKYTTAAERKMLNNNMYIVSFLPQEFSNTPGLVKQKIKRNKQILAQRKAEAAANKGKYSTKVALER